MALPQNYYFVRKNYWNKSWIFILNIKRLKKNLGDTYHKNLKFHLIKK